MSLLTSLWSRANALATAENYRLVAIAVGAVQGLLVARFWLALRRDSRRAAPAFFPSVAVLVACKNVPPGFEENVLALLRQDYEGPHEFIFVTPRREDPAYRLLEPLLSRAAAKTALLSSEAEPDRCSGKIVDMLHALRRVKPEAAVLAFADDDVTVRPDWLRHLVAPLADAGTIASTIPAVFLGVETSLGLLVRMASLGVLNAYTATFPIIYGFSWAIRKKDFFELGVPALWARSIADDFFLSAVFRRTGKKIASPSRATPVCPQSYGWRPLLAQTLKDFQYTRFSIPWEWLLRGLSLTGKVYLWCWGLRTGGWAPLITIVAADVLTTFAAFEAYRRYLPDRFARVPAAWKRFPLWTALVAPLVPFMELPFFLASIVTRKVRWAGRTYRVKSLLDVEVLPS